MIINQNEGQTSLSLMDNIIQLAESAGKAILEVYGREDFGTTFKSDESPLTLADTASHKIIAESLKALTPEFPVLSEESQSIPYETRKNWDIFWLVDPLDGTKEFIKRNGEFTVNIALIRGCESVMGVVYSPVLDVLYYAEKGKGAFKKEKGGEAVPIHVTDDVSGGLKVVASRSHHSDDVDEFLRKLGPHECVNMGSSLKFCLVAEGRAHLYPRFIPTMEWDTAAAHCVAEEAGAIVQDLNGNPLTYNKENLLNPFFLVSSIEEKKYYQKIENKSKRGTD